MTILTVQAVRELTHAADVDRQAEWLKARGIPHRVNTVGRRRWVTVAEYHVIAWLEGRAVTPSTRPNMAAAAR